MKNFSVWNRFTFANIIGIAAFALCFAHNAFAQSSHVSGMRIDWGAWNFKPIYEDSTGTARVTGFLALAKEGTASGDNIVAVWYVRNSDQTWSKKSWLTSDAGEAIKRVKIITGISDADDASWEVSQDLRVLPSDEPESPKDYSLGLLADDPLYPLVSTSSDAAGIVAILTDVGYKAADITIDNSTNFTTDDQLEVMAGAIEAGLAITVIDENSATAQTETTSSMLASLIVQPVPTPVPPAPVCIPGLTGPWVLGAVSPATACSWSVTDSWLPASGGRFYTCRYEYCCTYTRSRSAPAVRANCTTYTCTQIEVQRVCSAAIVCTVTVPTPTDPDAWVSPCSTSPICSAVPPVIPPAPAAAAWTWPNSTNCP